MRGRRLMFVGLFACVVVAAAALQALLTHAGAEQAAGPAPEARLAATAVAPAGRPTLAAAGASPIAGSSILGATATPAAMAVLTATATPTVTLTPPPTSSPTPAGPVKTGKGQPPAVSAASVAVVDEDSGRLLYEKAAHQSSAPASVTKITTAIVAIERGDPSTPVDVRFDASELVDSTLMGLRVGDRVTLEDLLYGLMLPSGNDAALAIAEHIAGSKARFVEMMNQKVGDLDLKDTRFVNPHGLDESGHQSSAYDLAMLARYGMQHYPLFVRLAGARSWSVGGSRPHEVYNLNKFLARYSGADGVKIGYTEAAGRTIVASARRGGRRVYVALMNSVDLVADTVPLMDYVFDNYTWPRP